AIASLSLATTEFAAGNRTAACPARSRQREWMAMTRRRLLCLLTTLLLVPAGWVGWRAITVPAAVRAYDRITVGMTLDEAARAIGAPPLPSPPASGLVGGDYLRQAGLPVASVLDSIGITNTDSIEGGPRLEAWTWDEDYWIWMAFGDDGKAIGLYLVESHG